MEDYFEKKKKRKILKRCLFKVNNLVNDLRIIWLILKIRKSMFRNLINNVLYEFEYNYFNILW